MSEVASFLIVVNPKSGRSRGQRMARALAARLQSWGGRVIVRETTASGDAEQLTREAITSDPGQPECVIACGGDGTIQEVAHALASLKEHLGTRCPIMGLAPAGRCNDFARALGIASDLDAIYSALTEGNPRAIDLGYVNGRYFCTVATLGIDAEVTRFVDSMRMPLRGTAAYLYGAICVLARYRAFDVRLRGDFGVIERPVFLASSANTSSYGGAIEIAPDASALDGQLDVCVIDGVSKLRALTLIPSVLFGRHQAKPEVQIVRTRQLQIDTPTPLELWADGEYIGTTPATIEARPEALRVLLPKSLPKEEFPS